MTIQIIGTHHTTFKHIDFYIGYTKYFKFKLKLILYVQSILDIKTILLLYVKIGFKEKELITIIKCIESIAVYQFCIVL